ncbi:dihydropteroate synthase [bacterium]|nr:dihydropteroate synthase [bacterium]
MLHCGPFRLKLSLRPHIMGIINLTPDSFSDGGLIKNPVSAFQRAATMLKQGADILDVGAESTRPGALPISVAEEKRRLLPALKRLARLPIPISVDTSKPEVAAAALEAGAGMINDITGLKDPAMLRLAARRRVPVVIMHMRGAPRSMQRAPRYGNVVSKVRHELLAAARRAQSAGVKREKIILDPGIGFGKTPVHNFLLLRELRQLANTGYPILVGPSRKSFLTAILGPLPPRERIWGTAAAVTLAVAHGARIIRVHDVSEMRMAAQVAHAIQHVKIPSRRENAKCPRK